MSMTREEQIFEVANSVYPRRWSGDRENGEKFDAFIQGAQWADQHPVNSWHDASKELPEMNGRTCQTIRYNKEKNRWV